MKAFWLKADNGEILGNEEAVFIFLTKQDAQHRLELTDAEQKSDVRIVELEVSELQ